MNDVLQGVLTPEVGWFVAGVTLLFVVVWRAGRRRRCSTLGTAAARLENGDLRGAKDLLMELTGSRELLPPLAHALLATAHIRAGHLGQAVCLLAMRFSQRVDPCAKNGALRELLAYAFLVAGAMGSAERTLAGTRLRKQSVVSYLLLARRGAMASVVRLAHRASRIPAMVRTTARNSGALGGHGHRVVALLTAFAIDQQERDGHRGRTLQIERFLDAARPRHADEFSYLTNAWPELRSFVERHRHQLCPHSLCVGSIYLPRAAVVKSSAMALEQSHRAE